MKRSLSRACSRAVSKLFPLLLLIVSAFTSSAQISFGVKGGVNLNFMSMKIDSRGRSPMNYTMETNLATHAGAFLKIPFNKHLAFKPGVDLIVRGAGRSERERLNIYYIDLPLSLQFDIGKKLYIEAGPVASLRVAARSYSYAYQNRITVSPSVEPFALGVSASVGYFVTQKLAFRGGVYSAITKAWDVSYRDVDNRPDGSVSYFPGNVSVGVEYNFTR